MGKIRKWMEELARMGPAKIAILAACGIFLMVTGVRSEPAAQGSDQEQTGEKDRENQTNEEYVKALENRFKEILFHVEGVGRTEVMITLASSEENVISKDISKEETREKESDEGINRQTETVKQEEETVLTGSGQGQDPFIIKQRKPVISGVLIACEGAGSNQVKEAVTEAAQAVFGVSAAHIKVLKMEEQQ